MNTLIRIFVFVALLLPGAAVAQTDAAATSLAELDALIAVDRDARPEIYAAVEAIRLEAPRMDRLKRGRLAVMGPAFEAMGPGATLAVVDALLQTEPAGQNPSVRRAWRVGMFNALRGWRDPTARPALEALLDRPERDLVVLRANAEALAILMDDEAVDFLLPRAQPDTERGRTIASALGLCRRARTAEFLATQLQTASGERYDVLLEALGDVANVWAWQTDVVAASGESTETRTIARDALIDLYLDSDGERANEATKNILLANVPGTADVLAQLRVSASAEQRERIDTLIHRVQNNPLNRRR